MVGVQKTIQEVGCHMFLPLFFAEFQKHLKFSSFLGGDVQLPDQICITIHVFNLKIFGP